MNHIVTLYWDNIDPRIVDIQRKVFLHLGYTIDQRERTGTAHDDFLDRTMLELSEDDTLLIVDIDCFPTNRDIVERAFAAAHQGRLFGCAQSSNHIDADRVFIAPMFMSISRRTWERIGRPSFKADAQNDVAQRLCDIAATKGVALEFLYPWGAIVPKWRLANIALYGIGTFFTGGVFHLFESRQTIFDYILFDVADAVLNDRAIDYLALMSKASRVRGDIKLARSFHKRKISIFRACFKITQLFDPASGKGKTTSAR